MKEIIARDPRKATLKEERYVEKDGAREKQERTVGPFEMWLRPKLSSSDMIEEGGRKHFVEWTGLIHGADVDLQWSADAHTRLEVEDVGEFVVETAVALRPSFMKSLESEIVGYHVKLRQVKMYGTYDG